MRIVPLRHPEWNLPASIEALRRPSIREWLVDASRTPDPFPSLPDDDLIASANSVPFATGALEGIGAVHGMRAHDADLPGEMARRIVQVATTLPPDIALSELYDAAKARPFIDYADSLLEQLRRRRNLPAARVHLVGHWLMDRASDRNAVKLGIGLLAIAPCGRDLTLLEPFARHDEFTLVSVVAARNVEPDPTSFIFDVARSVHGWGRIHAVQRLRGTTDPQVQSWLLRQGFRNGVMNEYLAFIAATTGNLLAALAPDEIDDELYRGASGILTALISGGPAEDIEDYRDASKAVIRFLYHSHAHARAAQDFVDLTTIRDYVMRLRRDDDPSVTSWTAAQCQEIVTASAALIHSDAANAAAAASLEQVTSPNFAAGCRLAIELHLAVEPALLRRLEQDPFDSWAWSLVFARARDERIPTLVELALSKLPIPSIATGPDRLLGLGPEFRLHNVVDSLVQALAKHPGCGLLIVVSALRSPVTRNRNLALRTLEVWGLQGDWGTTARAPLAELAASDPDEKVRAKAAALIAG